MNKSKNKYLINIGMQEKKTQMKNQIIKSQSMKKPNIKRTTHLTINLKTNQKRAILSNLVVQIIIVKTRVHQVITLMRKNQNKKTVI